MSKIIGNPTVTPPPKPDWNQTDSSKGDYIKNKPTTEEIVDAVLEALPTWEGGSY